MERSVLTHYCVIMRTLNVRTKPVLVQLVIPMMDYPVKVIQLSPLHFFVLDCLMR